MPFGQRLPIFGQSQPRCINDSVYSSTMAKKKSPPSKTQGFGTKRLLPELQKAEGLMVRKKWMEAREVLENLSLSYPQQVSVLEHLVNVCYEMHDIPAYTRACERLLKVDPKNADAAYGLAGGYLTSLHPLLALQAFHHALDRFPHHEKAKDVHQLISTLEEQMEETLVEMGLTGEEGRKIALLHEQGQAYLEQGEYQKARQTEESVLQLKPDFLSAVNNLSLISYAQGNLDEAITIAHQVLEQEPDNIHALSNLVRFCYLNNQTEAAAGFADRLKASHKPGWDIWTKKVEALSYLGDDAGILETFEQAKAADDLKIASPLFHHLVAVAMERSGQSKQARQQWQRALERSPGFRLAQDNLSDLKLPTGQRHGPWAFSFQYWFGKQEADSLSTILPSLIKAKEGTLEKLVQEYLDKHPNLKHLIPTLLERGDPAGREFAFRFASMAATPELLSILRDFALSQHGPDQMRYQAAIKASEAGLLSTEAVRMWIQGKWHDISLIAYEFHNEPLFQHSRQVKNWLSQAISLLHEDNPKAAEQAESLLQQALEAEPDSPDLLNNLATAYDIQERTEEAHTLIRQISEQHPDYIFARLSIARLHIRQGELEAAEALVKPFLSRKRFHFDEFSKFSSTYIELLMAQNNKPVAESWLKMWESVDPDDPELMQWKLRLGGKGLMNKLSNLAKRGFSGSV